MKKTIIAIATASALLIATPAIAADTVFGMSAGDSNLAAQDKKFGHVDVARIFNDGAPKAWSKMPKRSTIVSFKFAPAEVVAGRHDSYLRNWFSSAPRAYPVWWSYWHEPEDNFGTPAKQKQYRNAWQHIVKIERANAPSNLRSTFIHTLHSAQSGSWSKTYPGDSWIEVLGWDGKLHTWDGGYTSAPKHYAAAVRVSNQHNKPWGLAEYGSVVFKQNYQGRADWMRNTAKWLQNSGAQFAAWWPTAMNRNGALQDHRLNDSPSISAMKWQLKGDWQ